MCIEHPEARPHEMFLMNARPFEWSQIPYLSKRRGNQAYSQNGTPCPLADGAFPVFILLKEYIDPLVAPGGM